MLSGDLDDAAFSTTQLAALERSLSRASKATGATFTAFIGSLPAGRQSALALHRHSARPDHTVLIAVDPAGRSLEIVTGAALTEHLDDQSCRLAALAMTSRFSIGDIAAGVRDGITVLAEHARSLRILHTDLPN